MWVWDSDTKRMIYREIKYVPGFFKIVDEILVNAADNKVSLCLGPVHNFIRMSCVGAMSYQRLRRTATHLVAWCVCWTCL